ncbi:hypothetical protein OsI_36168 [Oryza sativa Indica Group]|uniref:NB-ARC domain-containing protein n=1 Tax=Oryza sativa subsp. indica TaxID=39946 RepID=B8BKL6_ORYSI|nr:hypothetical protein OsI_36168 [Oryza sativa Indica Group]
MAELFASMSVKWALDKLSSLLPASLQVATAPSTTSEGLEDLRMLERTMRRIHAMLHDAEEHWIIREESAKLRLTELKELAYDAEDVVDEYKYEANRVSTEVFERSLNTCNGKQYFDTKNITQKIISSLTKESSSLSELADLQEVLGNKLQGKSFLLVLDDVWTERRDTWELLCMPLFASSVCRIMVTTRNEAVAKLVQTMPFYHLDCLSSDDSWGLPLAIKTLGSMLRYEADEVRWRYVLESDIWDLEPPQKEILPALELSYRHLPIHLKRCFVALSLFPKDEFFMLEADDGCIEIPPNVSICNMGELKSLNKIKELTVRGLADLDRKEDAKEAWLHNKRHLQSLHLDFSRAIDLDDSPDYSENTEFCSHGHGFKGFPALKKLKFVQMPEWSEWSGVDDGAFPRLHRLSIRCADNILSLPVAPFLSLVSFQVTDCPNITAIPASPSLRQLHICRCVNLDQLPSFPSLTTLRLGGPFKDNKPCRLLNNLSSLECLTISCNLMTCISLEPQGLPLLRKIKFSSDNLQYCHGLSGFTSLKELNITECPKLLQHSCIFWMM